MTHPGKAPVAHSLDIRRVEFARRKYGDELLIDVDWTERLPGFDFPRQPHQLLFYDLILITAGSGGLVLDLDWYPVAPGTVLFTTPGQTRAWRLEGPGRGIVLFFTADFMSEFFNDPLFLHKLQFFHASHGRSDLPVEAAESDWLIGRLEEMRAEIRSRRRDSVHLLRAICYEVLLRLNRLYGERFSVEQDTEAHTRVDRFRALVEERFRGSHRVDDYARAVAMTPGHLNELCRRHTGHNAKHLIDSRIYVEARRLLLYTAADVARIAYGLGFQDPSYFARFFRRMSGSSPSAYRQKIREKYL